MRRALPPGVAMPPGMAHGTDRGQGQYL
jgi:hypothetical protein